MLCFQTPSTTKPSRIVEGGAVGGGPQCSFASSSVQHLVVHLERECDEDNVSARDGLGGVIEDGDGPGVHLKRESGKE